MPPKTKLDAATSCNTQIHPNREIFCCQSHSGKPLFARKKKKPGGFPYWSGCKWRARPVKVDPNLETAAKLDDTLCILFMQSLANLLHIITLMYNPLLTPLLSLTSAQPLPPPCPQGSARDFPSPLRHIPRSPTSDTASHTHTHTHTYTHTHANPACFGFVCVCVCFYVYVLLCVCYTPGLLHRPPYVPLCAVVCVLCFRPLM